MRSFAKTSDRRQNKSFYIKVKRVPNDEILKKVFDGCQRRAGRTYNIVLSQSLLPEILDASIGFYEQACMKTNRISRRLREIIAVVVSRENNCHY